MCTLILDKLRICFQLSETASNTLGLLPTLGVCFQHSKSASNTRSLLPTLEVCFQHSESASITASLFPTLREDGFNQRRTHLIHYYSYYINFVVVEFFCRSQRILTRWMSAKINVDWNRKWTGGVQPRPRPTDPGKTGVNIRH